MDVLRGVTPAPQSGDTVVPWFIFPFTAELQVALRGAGPWEKPRGVCGASLLQPLLRQLFRAVVAGLSSDRQL